MKHGPSESFTYRGVSICIHVEDAGGHVFGHADLLAGTEFMGRVSLGSARSSRQVIERLRCLAKAKVDVATVIHAATAECAKARDSDRAGAAGQN